jgi:hypothetical protein
MVSHPSANSRAVLKGRKNEGALISACIMHNLFFTYTPYFHTTLSLTYICILSNNRSGNSSSNNNRSYSSSGGSNSSTNSSSNGMC